MKRADGRRRRGAATIRYFIACYPFRTAGVFVVLVLSSVAEGIGLVSLLPLLNLTLGSQGTETSPITEAIGQAFAVFGVELSLGSILVTITVALSVKAALDLLAMRHVGYVMAQIATDFRLKLVRAVLSARWNFFISRPLGQFTNAFTNESARAASLYIAICRIMAAVVQLAVYLGAAVLVSLEIMVVALLAGSVIWLALGQFVKMARHAGQSQALLVKSLSARIADHLQGIKPLKAMGLERRILPLFEDETQRLKRALQRQTLAKHGLSILREPIIVIFVAAGLYFAFSTGQTDTSTLILMAVLFHRTVNAIGKLQENYQQISAVESFFHSIHELTESASHACEHMGHGVRSQLSRELSLERASFSYPGRPVLDRVSLTIPVGQLTALVGPSGVGKTTVADLICGLQQTTEGRILVDGEPLDNLDLAGWREQLGYVPQETFLFHESVRINVTLGDARFNGDAVITALQQAGAWDFVADLPDGMDTVIGERGAKLSGGQRQRLAIARALVRSPRLLILDEATTGLDPETERAICATLKALTPALTILAISHQPAVIDVADRIYRLEAGHMRREQ